VNSTSVAVACTRCAGYDEQAELRRAVADAVAAVGGWPECVLQPGAKVLLKPNLLSARAPEEAISTHPELVRAVIGELHCAGVRDLTIGDSPAGRQDWEKLWAITGMRTVADATGAKLLPFERVHRVEIAGVGPVPVLAELSDFTAVISLPKLKSHLLTKHSGAVKNSYGLMPGLAKSGFHVRYPSPRRMANFLAEFYRHTRPHLVIMDAVDCLVGEGPANGRPHRLGRILAGLDAVAVDAVSVEVFGYGPEEIPLLARCAELGLGVAERSAILRVGNGWEGWPGPQLPRSRADFLQRLPEWLFRPMTWLLSCRPEFDQVRCVKCGICRTACQRQAIHVGRDGRFRVNTRRCILCMCCLESCPHQAVALSAPGMRWPRWLRR